MDRNQKRKLTIAFGLCLVAILLALFIDGFNPTNVLFANDGPLGVNSADMAAQPAGYTGLWHDLNSIGYSDGSFFLSITSSLLWLLGPLGFAKFYPPLVLLILGLCVWCCLRQLKLSPLACFLGGFAAVLNSSYFSIACWGVGPQAIAAGMNFLAIGLLANPDARLRWPRTVLAGMAVGMGVMEAFDVGALYSVLTATFLLFHTFVGGEGPFWKRAGIGFARLGTVGIVALFLAAQAVTILISTQIKGVAGTQQDTRTKMERWDWATQWSFPKRETLSLFIPGLFGYRMDTPKDMSMFSSSFDGGVYWGAIGRDPAWDRYFASGKQGPQPQGFMRFSGGGGYAGVLVVLTALWSILQLFRGKNSIFNSAERKFLWFWAATLAVALLLAWGRFAPFYWLLYQLPYSSTVRNPAKFLHYWNVAVLFLFTFGIHALSRHYIETSRQNLSGIEARFKSWWAKAAVFEKRWVIGSIAGVVVSILGWLIYFSSRNSLAQYLQTVAFDESMARAIASFSTSQVGWFVLFLILSVGLMLLIFCGTFAGRGLRGIGILLGLLLVVDLGRANLPWIISWNYQQKYATNPILERLREKPYQQRVAILPFRSPAQLSLIEQLYRIEWAQHHFLYFNIQSTDLVQMPRMPEDLKAFESTFQFQGTPETTHLITRRWALTNTRYLLGAAGFIDALNQQIDPEKHRFKIVERFNIVPKPGIPNPSKLEELTAEPAAEGSYALIEFTGALPRAKLFANWQKPIDDPAAVTALKSATLNPNELEVLQSFGTNDFLTLQKLAAPTFDPEQMTLVANSVPAPDATSGTNGTAGTVEFVSYAPKDIRLKANAASSSILVLNDRFDPNWKAWVDGKPVELLRCNFIVRGVQIPAGEHTVEFKFQPPTGPLYVSLAAIALGMLLLGFVVVAGKEEEQQPTAKTAQPASSKTSKTS